MSLLKKLDVEKYWREYIVRAVSKEELADTSGEVLEKQIAEHCRKKLEERSKPAPERFPSNLDRVLKEQLLISGGCSQYQARWYLDGQSGLTPSDYIEACNLQNKRAPAATERTCSTCSKTCDVGQKCWWCGNA